MKAGQASRTAQHMALFRAMESALPAKRRLFEDQLAAKALSGGLRFVAALSRVPGVANVLRTFIDHNWPGVRTSGVARTRFIDDQVKTGLAAGAAQVVILGAGFDARAYRLTAMAGRGVFEVDHPSTSAAKQTVVKRTFGALPQHLRFVAVNFDTESLAQAMNAAGYDANKRTLFIWEGVTNYLGEAAIDATLRWCASAAVGSTVIFTYIHREVLEHPQAFFGGAKMTATVQAVGERWTFGLEPTQLADFLKQRGLILQQDVGASDYRAKYYGAAAQRMRGYEFYRIAVAEVAAHEAVGAKPTQS
jgi:methyltransferase (TIGR00027 family)